MVLGVERGGTSMVAGVLRALGIDMGLRVGIHHEDPWFLEDDKGILKRRIRVRNKQSDVWGFKIPKAAQSLDFFESNLRNPHYVVVFRNMLSIAESMLQRDSVDLFGSFDRALNYYSHIIDHCRNTARPVLMLNYERSSSTDAGKEEAVRALAKFVGVELDDQSLGRAIAMITGDGEGYVQLPEYLCAVAATQRMPERAPLGLQLFTPELCDAGNWIDFKSMTQKLAFGSADGAPLPTSFWLRVEIDGPVDFSTGPLRIYLDYVGAFFPGHSVCPPVKRGTNYFFVQTSGMAKAVALGPIRVPMRLRIQADAFAALPGDDDLAPFGVIAEKLTRVQAGRRSPLRALRAWRQKLFHGN